MTEESSLYTRLGGYDVLARIVDDFLARLARDATLHRFATGMNDERKRRNRQLTLDFLAHSAGGPVMYLGQDMKTAHDGLGINRDDWNLARNYFRQSAEGAGLAQNEASELVGVFDSVANDIVDPSC